MVELLVFPLKNTSFFHQGSCIYGTASPSVEPDQGLIQKNRTCQPAFEYASKCKTVCSIYNTIPQEYCNFI